MRPAFLDPANHEGHGSTMTSTTRSHLEPATATALDFALSTVRANIPPFGGMYPGDTTVSGHYRLREAENGIPEGGNRGWTTSFWPGMQWLAWEVTGDTAFRDAALLHAADFARRERVGEDLDTHDLGFLYSLASVTAWRLTGDRESRAAALAAADRLMGRFLEPAGIIQAWGDLSDPRQRGRTIIDSLMNMPLLSWAGEETGEPRYAEAVRRHTTQLREHILRDDDSTFHTFYWDPETGAALRGGTEQGAFDDSCWARGQAWGIYGFALNYRTTHDETLLVAARRCADYFLAHLPLDGVPYWDLVFTDGSDAPRDSSSGAIAATGLIELAGVETDALLAQRYSAAADAILNTLASEYAPGSFEESDALLLHGVYDLPKKIGVGEGTLWGDYFYLEALTRRAIVGWRSFW
jgi:unsaturated chondroitin disaccharide hydrolase